jgi:hypothetical protein
MTGNPPLRAVRVSRDDSTHFAQTAPVELVAVSVRDVSDMLETRRSTCPEFIQVCTAHFGLHIHPGSQFCSQLGH